jgi:hypothetical protein
MYRALIIATVLGACSDRRVSPPPPDDAAHPRRKIDHPRSAVYSLPPHLIEPGRIGPYTIGDTLAGVLYAIPAGPGIEVLDIPRVVRLSVIRVEEDRMMVGGDPAIASFVSVLAPEVARTQTGIEVGAARAAVVEALGAPVAAPRHAVDPRLVAVAAVPGLRFVVESDKVVAAMLSPAPAPAPARPDTDPEPAAPACAIDRSETAAAALRTALGGEPARIDCLSATEAIAAVDGELVVITTGDKPRKLHTLRVPDLVFAGVTHAGGKEEIFAVTLRRTDKRAVWTVIAARWEAGRIVKTFEEDAYELTAQSAGWLGQARLDDLDVLLDLEARSDTIVVSGVLLGRAGSAIRLAVPLEPISLTRRKRTVPEAAAAGSGDASVQPLGDAAPPPGDAGP